MDFEEIKNLIDNSPNIEFGSGVSDDMIRKAEEKLEFTFPKEYKLWLKNYGWGEIYGEDIFGLYNEEFNSYPNVVFTNLKMRQENFVSGNELAVQMNDFTEIYFFEKDNKKVFINCSAEMIFLFIRNHYFWHQNINYEFLQKSS